MQLPGEPSGSGSMISWLRRLRNFVQSLQIQPGVGYKVKKRGPGGTILEIQAGGGGAGASVSRYRIESIAGDYIVAHTYDGTTEGTVSQYIAKPYKLRHSITLATIDGNATTYSYSTVADNLDKKRIAVIAGTTEDQYVVPRWLTDDEVFAISAQPGVNYTEVTGTVTTTAACTLLDINTDARMWAAEV